MSSRDEASEAREARRARLLRTWAKAHAIDLDRFDDGQRWGLFAALQMLSALGSVAPLRRLVIWLMAHSGLELGSQALAALGGVTDRAVRLTQSEAPEALLHSLQHPVGGHRAPALEAHHAGPVARFLAHHPHASVAQILAFLEAELHVTIERHTLRHFIQRYGLGCLQGDQVTDAPPLLAARPSVVRSS